MKTRAWLDSLQEERSGLGRLLLQWRAHRANVYLAAAAALLVMVLLGGGAQDSTRTTAQNPDPKAPPQPELSVFDKALISLGLAEPPPVPVDAGNPGTRVWVDTHTALYYCPGSDLYGKTQGGRFATQQEAEMDAFQPASRKPCD